MPGVDSQQATDLLTAAGSDQAGLTAQVVVTPRDEQVTFFNSADARAALAQVQSAAAELPQVLGTSDPAGTPTAGPQRPCRRSPRRSGRRDPGAVSGGRGTGPGDLRTSNRPVAGAGRIAGPDRTGRRPVLHFEAPETGLGEAVGLFAAIVVLLLAFGSIIAMGLPIGMALFGLALGISSMSLVADPIDIPSWAPVLGSMVGLGVGIDYALFIVVRHREYLARGMTVQESAGRAVATAGQAVVFRYIAPEYPYTIWMPQPIFLEAFARKASEFPGIQCWMGARVTELLEEQGAVVGVRGRRHGAEPFEIRADVVVGADGRHSRPGGWAGSRRSTSTTTST